MSSFWNAHGKNQSVTEYFSLKSRSLWNRLPYKVSEPVFRSTSASNNGTELLKS